MSANAFHKLRDEIENGIVTGEFARGERLDEVQLAQRFGVSRTPIREALMQLSAIGLISIRPRRGAVVDDPTPERLYEMFEVMAELEGMAASLAARRHTNEDKAALQRALKACEAAAATEDADAYYYENEEFHSLVYVASHSDFLHEQCVALHRRLRPYRRLQLRVRNRLHKSLAEHVAVVEAILDGRSDDARAMMRSHISVQGERFSDLIASLRADDQRATKIV